MPVVLNTKLLNYLRHTRTKEDDENEETRKYKDVEHKH